MYNKLKFRYIIFEMFRFIFQMVSTLQAQPPVNRNNPPPFEPRLVFPQMKKSGDLGVRLVSFSPV